jgi:hypothetical protein
VRETDRIVYQRYDATDIAHLIVVAMVVFVVIFTHCLGFSIIVNGYYFWFPFSVFKIVSEQMLMDDS